MIINEIKQSFESLWDYPFDSAYPPNKSKTGWSKVGIITLDHQGKQQRFALKKMENYNSFTLVHPFKGVPKAENELGKILSFRRLLLPTVEPVYYKKQMFNGESRAILMTRFLEGHVELSRILRHPEGLIWENNRPLILAMIREVAKWCKAIHDNDILFGHLQTKHIMVGVDNAGAISVRFIDMESMRKMPFMRERIIVKDLASLLRTARFAKSTDIIRFAHHYFGEHKFSPKTKRIMLKVLSRAVDKGYCGCRKPLKRSI